MISSQTSRSLLQKYEADSLGQLNTTQEEAPALHENPNEGFFKIGDVVSGLYEILRGCSGGMGKIDIVWHRGWNTNLIIKTPKKSIWANEKARESYIREAQTWIELGKHPNITTAFYVREIQGIPRIIAEYADAGNLHEWIQQHDLNDWRSALDVSIQIIDGLLFAHKKGLVHRDLKPGNILLWKDGTAKLTDFGLAIANSGSVMDLEKEKTEKLIGTPAFASPEQWVSPALVGSQSDIYSLGLILYEILCGRPPFQLTEDEKNSILKHEQKEIGKRQEMFLRIWKQKHLTEFPNPLRLILPDISDDLDHLIMSCMAKDPGQRPARLELIREGLLKSYKLIFQTEYPRVEIGDEVLLAADFNNRGVSYVDLGRRDEALRNFEKALKLDALHPEAIYNHSFLRWRSAEITDEDFLSAVSRLDPSLTTTRFRQGLCQIARQDLLEAEQLLQSVVDKSGNQAECLKYLGVSQLGTRKPAQAEESFNRAAVILPTDPDIMRYRNLNADFRHGIRLGYEIEENFPVPIDCSFMEVDRRSGTGIWSRGNVLLEIETLTGKKNGEIVLPNKPDPNLSCAALGDGYVLLADRNTQKGNIWNLRSGALECQISLPEEVFFIPKEFGSRLSWANGTLYCLSRVDGRFNFEHVMACQRDGSPPIPFIPVHMTAFFHSQERNAFITGHDGSVEFWDNGIVGSSRVLRDGNMGKVHHLQLLTNIKEGSDFILFSCSDGLIRLWEVPYTVHDDFAGNKTYWHEKEGQLVRMKGHADNLIFDVTANSSLTRIASCGGDQTIRIWDAETGMCIRTIPFALDWGSRLSFLNDVMLILYKAGGKPFILYLPEFSIDIPMELSRPQTVIETLSTAEYVKQKIAESGEFLKKEQFESAYQSLREAQASLDYEHDEQILGAMAGLRRFAKEIDLHAMWLKSVFEYPYPVSALHPLSQSTILAGVGGTLLSIDLQHGGRIAMQPEHHNLISSISVSGDQRYVLSTADDMARIWDMDEKKTQALLKINNPPFSTFFKRGCVNSQWTRAVTSGQKTIIMWDLEIEEMDQFHNFEEDVVDLAVSSDDRSINLLLQNGAIYKVDMFERRSEQVGHLPVKNIFKARYARDGLKYLVFTKPSSPPVIMDIQGDILDSFPEAPEATAGDFFDNGRLLVLAGNRGLWVFLLNSFSHKLLYSGINEEGVLEALTVASNGRYICLGFQSGKLQVWELDFELRFS